MVVKHEALSGNAPRPATVDDVARLAGVSTMTVSRVVNCVPAVRPALRAKVLAAIATLNYMPNPSARKLAGSEPIVIGLPYSDARAGYLSGFALGLLGKISLRHVQLTAHYCSSASDCLEAVSSMLSEGIDGFILPPPFCEAQPVLDLIASSGTPTVTVSAGKPHGSFHRVGIDDYRAAYDMTRHLLFLGHRKLGFITGDPAQSSSELRLAGFRAALSEAGIHLEHDVRTVEGRFTYHSGLDAAEQLLSCGDRPSAIFASNDDMAAATVAVAHRMGLYVPSDLTVVGFDDAPLATTIWPELTTVRQPIVDMAGMAVDVLMKHIRAKRDGVQMPLSQQITDYTLIRRQSDAAPKRRPAARLSVVA